MDHPDPDSEGSLDLSSQSGVVGSYKVIDAGFAKKEDLGLTGIRDKTSETASRTEPRYRPSMNSCSPRSSRKKPFSITEPELAQEAYPSAYRWSRHEH
jgi:hypothetical protein